MTEGPFQAILPETISDLKKEIRFVATYRTLSETDWFLHEKVIRLVGLEAEIRLERLELELRSAVRINVQPFQQPGEIRFVYLSRKISIYHLLFTIHCLP